MEDEDYLLLSCQKRLDSINERNWAEALQLSVELEDKDLFEVVSQRSKEYVNQNVFNFLKQQFENQHLLLKENQTQQKSLRIQRQVIKNQKKIIHHLEGKDSPSPVREYSEVLDEQDYELIRKYYAEDDAAEFHVSCALPSMYFPIVCFFDELRPSQAQQIQTRQR